MSTIPAKRKPRQDTDLSVVPATSYGLLRYSDLVRMEAQLEIIEDILPSTGSSCIYGRSGAGKTFLALDMALAIARGDQSWFGYRIMQVPVIYAALEGVGGIKNRLYAHAEGAGKQIPDAFMLMTDGFSLGSPTDVARLILTAKEFMPDGGLIVIDTMTRAAAGLDLNGPSGMGEAIAAIDRISRETNTMVQTVYHSTSKDNNQTATELGHSSYRGSLDASIFVHSGEGGKKWTSVKVKDGEDGLEHPFALERQVVGLNQWGVEKTSCFVVASGDRQKAQNGESARKVSTAGNQSLKILEGLYQRYQENLSVSGGDPKAALVSEYDWRTSVYDAMGATSTGTKRQRFRRARIALIEAGEIRIDGKYVHIVREA